MSASIIQATEIVDLLRKALSGDVPVKAIGQSWSETYCGDVELEIGDYKVIIFNDCEELDYVSEATAPDGRTGDFDAWYDAGGDPISFLSQLEIANLENLFEAVKP